MDLQAAAQTETRIRAKAGAGVLCKIKCMHCELLSRCQSLSCLSDGGACQAFKIRARQVNNETVPHNTDCLIGPGDLKWDPCLLIRFILNAVN
jgi:hypothetical protein